MKPGNSIWKGAVIDFGTRSAKLYRVNQSGDACIVDVQNWAVLEGQEAQLDSSEVLSRLLQNVPTGVSIQAIGTAAMRRDAKLEEEVSQAAQRVGVDYRTITQKQEVDLIQSAAARAGIPSGLDIVNVGGGSMQFAQANQRLELVGFGISDLNARFDLNKCPDRRRSVECIEYLCSKLPQGIGPFVYTGGESQYLKAIGVPLLEDGYCRGEDFRDGAERLLLMNSKEMDMASPFGPGWMSGAVASNCIVLSILRLSGEAGFFASDINIADGLIQEVI